MFNLFKKYSENPLFAKSLRFRYKNKEILDNLDVDIEKSKIVAIIGKSGCGKSTFLKLITGVLSKSYKGLIRIMGKPTLFSKKNIGYIPQDFSLIPDLTIEENIKFFGKLNGIDEAEAMERGLELLETLHINENLLSLPNELSGGQKVRLNIIVSILHNPFVIIADEPFVGLDFLNRKMLWNFFISLKKQKKTIILTSHLLSEIEKYVDQILILSNGRIALNGSPKQIKEKLKTKSIIEVKFKKKLNKEQKLDLKEFERKNPGTLIDYYEDMALFNIANDAQKKKLSKYLNANKMKHAMNKYKQPNLDEAFMSMK